jgi:hypothetical protein
MPSPAPTPASLAAQVEAEKGLPEEIVKAIRHLTTVCMLAPGFNDAVIANRNIRNGVEVLTATVLARLTAAESARDEARATNRELHRRLQAAEGPTIRRAEKAEAAAAFWLNRRKFYGGRAAAERRRADAALARAERLEEALKPFGGWAEALEAEFGEHEDDVIAGGLNPDVVTFGDLRRALAALAQPAPAEET